MSDRSSPVPHSFQRLLSPLPTGWQPISYTIFADGTLALLSTNVDLAGEHQRVKRVLPSSPRLNPVSRLKALSSEGTAQVWTACSSGWVEAFACPLEKPYPIIDRFDDGRWLTADSGFDGGANARLFSRDGALLGRLRLGDGIQHIVTDASNRIWVGWSDQGTGGNGDWDVRGHEYPPSLDGLGCFDVNGALSSLPDWLFEAGLLIECYALNITDRSALTCFYSHVDFRLIRVVPGRPVQWWRSEFRGSSAIAVDGAHALIAGGYGEDANRLVLVTLDGPGQGEDVCAIAQWALPLRRLPAPTSQPAPVWEHPALLTGRGDMLHLVDDGVWYCWRVSDLMTPR